MAVIIFRLQVSSVKLCPKVWSVPQSCGVPRGLWASPSHPLPTDGLGWAAWGQVTKLYFLRGLRGTGDSSKYLGPCWERFLDEAQGICSTQSGVPGRGLMGAGSRLGSYWLQWKVGFARSHPTQHRHEGAAAEVALRVKGEGLRCGTCDRKELWSQFHILSPCFSV